MTIINRTIFSQLINALSDQRVIVITGMRRVGKTTTLHWLLDQIPSTNKIFLDLERLDHRQIFQESNYDIVLNYFRNLGMDPQKPLTVALDEIQYAPNLPSVVKYLYDHYGIKFLLSGSSSFYLKNFFSESMAGRKIVYEMFPLGFGEFLDFKGVPYHRRSNLQDMLFDPYEFERLKRYYDEYVTYGGLPNIVLESDLNKKREILQDIYSSYINIDVKSMADFRKIGELQQLLKALAIRIGNKVNFTKLSLIIGISRPTLYEYLEFLDKTYIIHLLPAYAGHDKSLALGKKLYFRDNGIASLLAHPGDGALFENALFNQLWAYGSLSYLSKGNDYELDFILTESQNEPVGVEAKIHPVIKDHNRLKRIAQKNDINNFWLAGRYPTPDFDHFIWGGLIF
ncbi:MAG: ATP-binding protein [Anaerolineaceae bacterium]|nr:ATP-binding protein [Anaerolineaceae bacterium]